MKTSLGFSDGMIIGMSRPVAPGGYKYMDWEKAEKICLDHPDSTIEAGLLEDWGYTSGTIYDHGTWLKEYVYDQSHWATPIVDIDGKEIECWTHEPHKQTGVPSWWGRAGKKEAKP